MSDEKSSDTKEKVPAKKKGGLMGTIIPLVVCSLIAVGAGWFIAGQLASPPSEGAMKTANKEKEDGHGGGKAKKKSGHGEEDAHESKRESSAGTGVVVLDPILVALKNSQNAYLRLEIAVVADTGANLDSEENKIRLGSEIGAFVQTLSLAQMSGPSGYLHFREDITDRIRLFSEGAVKEVLIMSMVAE